MTRQEIVKAFEEAGINFEYTHYKGRRTGDWIDDNFTPVLDVIYKLTNK